MVLRRIILTCVLVLLPVAIITTRAFQTAPIVFYKAHGGFPSRQSVTTASTQLQGVSDPLSIGFLGCGTIASAIATGLAHHSTRPTEQQTTNCASILKIMVTRRSESMSTALQARFPDTVAIADDPQTVLDNSDIIFLCVLPQQTSSILQSLQFDDNRHLLVSLVSTSQIHQLAVDSKLPESHVSKMICLPAVARNTGVCLVQFGGGGDNTAAAATIQSKHRETILHLLERLGSFVEAMNDREMSALMVITGLSK
jgi:pyrroline-5-carboxylate reductase